MKLSKMMNIVFFILDKIYSKFVKMCDKIKHVLHYDFASNVVLTNFIIFAFDCTFSNFCEFTYSKTQTHALSETDFFF